MSQKNENYQKMLEKVEGIVEEISDPEMDLDKMVAKVENGYELIKKMRERLEVTKEQVEKLRKNFDSTEA